MDSITYNNITEYKTPLELNFLFARNKARVQCSCGIWINKGGMQSHWKGLKHRMITEHLLLSKDNSFSLPT